MAAPLWLSQLELLVGPGQPLQRGDALIDAQGRLQLWGEAAGQRAASLGLSPIPLPGCLLAPPLVDPHSALEQPWGHGVETLDSLQRSAAAGGYGTVALLPWASPWRDRPERLQGLRWPAPLQLHLWGSLSRDGAGDDLAPHADQLMAGAIGLAGGPDLPPLPLLERTLLLAEMGERPVLVAPRSPELSTGGFVREGVDALRAGWPTDPPLSEVLPLQGLLALAAARPAARLALMNLSTAAAVQQLRAWAGPGLRPAASVSWWHLLADSGHLDPTAEGWRLRPPLGNPSDRQALIDGVRDGLITAVAVHHLALDPEEQLLPLDQRRPGLAGHGAPRGLVLPALWQELVVRQGFSPVQLWQALCWGPAALLGLALPSLQADSAGWLLFDPAAEADWRAGQSLSAAANQPLLGQRLRGQVLASGLTPSSAWQLPAQS